MALFVLFGFGMMAVAYQAVRNFNPTVVKNIIGLLLLFLYGYLAPQVHPQRETAADRASRETQCFVTNVLPLLVVVLAYRVISRKLIKLTENETAQ